MKIQEIYKEEFIGKIIESVKLVNPNFYLFNKEVEHWEIFDWKLWAEIMETFRQVMIRK